MYLDETAWPPIQKKSLQPQQKGVNKSGLFSQQTTGASQAWYAGGPRNTDGQHASVSGKNSEDLVLNSSFLMF
ncbi:hypothetical protein ILYODFUR_015139 [Ilyodon furcidens]|uniref:Uncharacterized protein n=1 Tax=Ilyodon furcidens TaxID=33524 RepID=A0ABV0T855_9TELE